MGMGRREYIVFGKNIGNGRNRSLQNNSYLLPSAFSLLTFHFCLFTSDFSLLLFAFSLPYCFGPGRLSHVNTITINPAATIASAQKNET